MDKYFINISTKQYSWVFFQMTEETTIQKMIKEFGGFKRLDKDTCNYVRLFY